MDLNTIKKATDLNLKIEEFVVLEMIKQEKLADFQGLEGISVVLDGLALQGYCSFSAPVVLTQKGANLLVEIYKKPENQYEKLHKKLQDKLISLTGRKQKVLQGKYSFLPNAKDFSTRLSKVVKDYNLSNFSKVEKCLLNYTIKSAKDNWEYSQTIEYYISKNGISRLATEYEFIEDLEKTTLIDTTVNI